MLTEGQVAEFLLSQRFFLTALEFHQELAEDPDREAGQIPSALQVFSQLPDQGDHDAATLLEELSSQYLTTSTEDDDNGTPVTPTVTSDASHPRLKEMEHTLREREESIQVLEYQLRQATEASDSLRRQLTAARAAVTDTVKASTEAQETAKSLEDAEEMKVHEKRTLNYLVKNHLVRAGYKLTAITLAEEAADQDVDSWDDVGLDCSAPPSLLSFYRYFYNAGPNQFLNKLEEESRVYKKKAAKWKSRAKRIPELEATIHELRMTIKHAQEKPKEDRHSATSPEEEQSATAPAPSSAEEELLLSPRRGDEPRKFRFTPMQLPAIRGIDWMEENSSVAEQIQSISVLGKQEDGAVLVLGRSLPVITPAVLLKARKDILPVLLVAIQQHPDAKTRDQLTNQLFNLIKRPDEQQRQMIITGCVALAKLIGKERTEGELLPQCWEQINSRYEERRVLVAESCGALAAYSKSSMRVSLIMSMLVQLVDDKSELVRTAIAGNLAQLITYFEDTEKYNKVEEMLLRLFYDPCREVVEKVKSVLVPVFMEWSHALGVLLTRFLPLFMEEIGKLLKNMDPGRMNEVDVSRVEMLFDIVLEAMPRMLETVMAASPLSPGPPASKPIITVPSLSGRTQEETEDVFGNELGLKDKSLLLDEQQQKHLLEGFDQFLQKSLDDTHPEKPWEELQWLADDLLKRILQIICRSQSLEAPRIANGMAIIVSRLCSTFGDTFTRGIVFSRFEDLLTTDRSFLKSAKELENARKRAVPVFLLGVMTSMKDSELIAQLKGFILHVANREDGWSTEHFPMLRDSIRLLCTSANKTKQVVTLLTRELITHPSDDVRVVIVRLYEDIMLFLSASDLEGKLFPALITLSTDGSPHVRLATVKQLCNAAKIVNQKPLVEKIDAQFDHLLTDNGHEMLTEVLRQFTLLIPASTAAFRDNYLLPRLVKIISLNSHNENESQRHEGYKLLIDAYRAFNGCVLTAEMIEMFILPGLRLLQANSATMETAQANVVNRMVSDMERAVGANASTSSSQPSPNAKDEKKRWGRWGQPGTPTRP